MLTLKLSEEQMKELGVASAEDILARLTKKETVTPPAAVAAPNDLEARVKALEARTQPAPVDVTQLREDILKAARIEAIASASASVSAAIAKSGGSAVAPKETPVESNLATQIAPTDFKARWDADPKLRAESVSYEGFCAYERARLSGKYNLN